METDYGYNRDFEHHFAEVQVELGEIKARVEKTTGDSTATLLQKVGGASCDILTRVGDAECSINENVKDAQYSIVDKMTADNLAGFKDRSDIAQRQSSALNQVERDIQNRVHENRMILTKEIHEQADKVNENVTTSLLEVKNQMREFQIDQSNKFGISQVEAAKNAAAAALEAAKNAAAAQLEAAKNFNVLQLDGAKNTATIIDRLGSDKYDNMKDKIDALREECERGKWLNALAVQNAEFNSLKQMVNSVEQNQRFGSKTTQFGTGNTSGTAQTANQG